MIRVPVPIDVGTIAATANGVFARATPIRIDRLIALGVLEALGPRAPHDKRERTLRATLAGFRAGRFTIDVDGRVYDDPRAVVVVAGVVTLRFFSRRPERRLRS